MESSNDKKVIKLPSEKDKIKAARKMEFSSGEINKMLEAWQKEEKLAIPEHVIRSLFDDGTRGICKEVEKEFLKVCLVNQIYGTNLYLEDTLQIAKYLSENSDRLNEKLHSGDIAIISDITGSIKESRGKYCYSFATKYCSFAAPKEQADSYPIYDSYLATLYKTRTDIWNPNNKERFFNYYFDSWDGKDDHDSKRYEMYRKAVKMMQDELSNVRRLTIKQLDQYLWKAMKVYTQNMIGD